MSHKENLQNKQIDVFIIGGGLAGLTLALQLKQARPETSIVVAEKRKHPAPAAAFKVGESTLDGVGHYLGTILGLREYLEKEHLFKAGFRFFTPASNNQDITKRFELATILDWIPGEAAPSYQLDRGKLETKLGKEICQHGVIFLDGCKVKTLALDTMGSHDVTIVQEEIETKVKARWVIDASGAASMLKHQLNLGEEIAHDVNAAWFRVNKIISVQDWTDDAEWKARFVPEARRLATGHLAGNGYWVWLIPLAGDLTSIGIVADDTVHPFKQINRREQALEWLAKHEPQCAQAVANCEMLDFAVFKHFARGCTQVFSADRWAITGIAGVFSDPLYSSGSELITISNIIITDTICRELEGQAISKRVEFFNDFYLNFFFEVILADVQWAYPMFDSSLIVTIKKIWQFAWYYAVQSPLFSCRKLADIEYLTFIEEELRYAQTLHHRVQTLCQELYAQGPHHPSIEYFVYARQSVTLQQLVLKQPRDNSNEGLRELLRYNISVLESIVISLEQRLDPLNESIQAESAGGLSKNIQPDIVAEFKGYWRAWRAEDELVPV